MSVNDLNVTCSVCGEAVQKEFKFCPGCGAPVKNTDKTSVQTLEVSSKKGKKNNSPKAEKEKPSVKESQKVLSLAKLLYLVFAILIVGSLILFSSGIFDSPSNLPAAGNANQMQDFHKGVDLSSLQQIKTLEDALVKNPNDHVKLLDLAHLLNDAGFKEKAIEKYKLYLKNHPREADVLVDMGVCYYELGNNEEALIWMKEALKYQPKHQIAHLNLGVVTLNSGNHDEALEWWKKAVEINPSTPIAKRAQELINSH